MTGGAIRFQRETAPSRDGLDVCRPGEYISWMGLNNIRYKIKASGSTFFLLLPVASKSAFAPGNRD